MKGFLSIRSKFLLVMSGLLIACVCLYLLIAVQVFRADKTELVFDLNRSMTGNIAAELETEFEGVSEKFKVYALLSTQTDSSQIQRSLFPEDSAVPFVAIFRQDQKTIVKKTVNLKYLETYGLAQDFFEAQLINDRPIPFSKILTEGESIWNATVTGGTPLIGYGRSVIVEDAHGVPVDHLAVIGFVKPDKILKTLTAASLSDIAVTDGAGQILVHRNIDYMTSQKKLSDHPLFKAAKESKVGLSVLKSADEEGPFLGAFSKTYHNKFIIVAKAPEEKAFSAVSDLVSRSLIFALIVITVSLLVALLFSKSLTRPISILVDGMEQVSTGDLSTEIKVDSRDETQMLASSFNQMIHDLKKSRDELQEVNRDLDQKVQDRTRQLEIQNQAVKEAQEALLRTTRLASAGEIAGRTAHEVLNPLTGILARVQNLESRVKAYLRPQVDLMKDIFQSWQKDHDEGGFELLTKNWQAPSPFLDKQNIWSEDLQNLKLVSNDIESFIGTLGADTQFLLSEGGRINRIVDGMRKLSSLNSDLQTFSVQKLLTDCKNIMADLLSQDHIEIIENYSTEPDSIETDRDEFIQAITNLMRNSQQAIASGQKSSLKSGKPRITISTRVSTGLVSIFLTDNGEGISEENQKLLFEKKFTTKTPNEGTGLGLGISRRFIRAHGGDIQLVKSVPGEETCFRIDLPISSNTKQNDTKQNVGAA